MTAWIADVTSHSLFIRANSIPISFKGFVVCDSYHSTGEASGSPLPLRFRILRLFALLESLYRV